MTENEIMCIIRENPEGFTVYVDTGEKATHTKGYYVGIKPLSIFEVPTYTGKYIGGWKGELDGVFYTRDLGIALEVARTAQQKAIWDIANQKEIYLPFY